MSSNQYTKKKRNSPYKEDSSITEEVESSETEEYNDLNKIKREEKKKQENNNSFHPSKKEDIINLLQLQEQKFNEKINDLKIEKKNDYDYFQYLIKDLNSTIDALINGREIDKNIINKLIMEKEIDKKEREIDKKEISYLKNEINKLIMEKEIDKKEREIDREIINELINKNKELGQKVDELDRFSFSAKLRKLLKKLLEYIIKKYIRYMKYEKDKNKLYFIESPIQGLYGRKANETINALNEILGIIFSYSKKSDYTIHFVNKKAEKNKVFKEDIIVFEKYKNFSEFFKLSKNCEKILINLIPEKYFTIIDNSDLEKKIPYLISKLCK